MKREITIRRRLIPVALVMALAGCGDETGLPGWGDDDGGGAAPGDVGQDVGPDGGSTASQTVVSSGAGVCRPTGGRGAPCDEEAACDAALRCIRGYCEVESVVGVPCESSADCVDGLFCRRHDDVGRALTSPWCAVERTRGQSCQRLDAPCADRRRCIEGRCQTRSAVGEPCAVNADCLGGLFCRSDAPGGPSCLEELGVGESCDDEDRCGDRLRCLDGLCQPRGRGDDRCERQSDCQSGFYCDQLHGDGTERLEPICRPEAPLSAVCDDRETSSCTSPGHCLGGRCLDDLAHGEACERSTDCASGLFCADPP